MRVRHALCVGALHLMAVLVVSNSAQAFSIASGFTIGCHEGITFTAYSRAGIALDATTIVLPEEDDWKNTVEFLLNAVGANIDDETERYFFVSLLSGVRSPDTDGHSTLDLLSLRSIHADPKGQYAHCLREVDDDGAEGDIGAARGCHDYIESEMQIVADLLEKPPKKQNIEVDFAVDFYGGFDLVVWGPAFHLGRAAHALQDSFSHTVRSRDLNRIYSFLNYAEAIGGSIKKERDGLPHSDFADRCDEGTREVPAAAVDATVDLMRAVDSYARTRSEGHFEAFTAKWLSFQAGCTLDNDFCDSPWVERASKEPTGPILGCSIPGAGQGSGASPAAALGTPAFLLALYFFRALRRPRVRWRWLACMHSGRMLALTMSLAGIAGCNPTLPREPLSLQVFYPVGGTGDFTFADTIASAISFSRWQFRLDLSEFEPQTLEEANTLIEQAFDLSLRESFLVTVGTDYDAALIARDCALVSRSVLHIDSDLPLCPGLQSVVFTPQSASFLAAVAAVEKIRMENEDREREGQQALPLRVAAFGAVDIPQVRAFLDSFAEGVAYAGGELLGPDFLGEDSTAFGDVAAAKAEARDLFAQARVVFPVAGGASLGAVDAASELRMETGESHFVIGVDSDISPIAPEVVLGSVLKRSDNAVRQAIFAFADGEFVGGRTTVGDSEFLLNLIHDTPTSGVANGNILSSDFRIASALTEAEAELQRRREP